MAELEVAEHGKKVIQLARSKEHGLAHRVREILLEIAIIVFAVSISIWFHSLSEHRHEQKQVRAFLQGLKVDLQGDIQQLENISKGYHAYDANFAELAALDPKGQPDGEKFDKAFQEAGSNWFFLPEIHRFDGFKSSGKLTNIEDQQLLKKILFLYQGQLLQIRNSEAGWRDRHNKLRDYLEDAEESGDDRAHRFAAIVAPKGKRLLKRMPTTAQHFGRYRDYIIVSQQIIQRIDELYGKDN